MERCLSSFPVYTEFIIWLFYNCIGWKTWYSVHHPSVVFIETGHHTAVYDLLTSARETLLLRFVSKPFAAWGVCSFETGQ